MLKLNATALHLSCFSWLFTMSSVTSSVVFFDQVANTTANEIAIHISSTYAINGLTPFLIAHHLQSFLLRFQMPVQAGYHWLVRLLREDIPLLCRFFSAL